MKYSITLIALASSAAATFKNAPPFPCPANTDNKCTDQQKPGFAFDDLPGGGFQQYKDFFWNGWTANQGAPGGRFGRRTGGKSIGGICKPDKNQSPSFGCGPKVDKFSLGSIHVKPEFDCDLEFHYDMPDGKKCKHRNFCKKTGTTVINTQCGGAKNVTIVYPPQPNKPKPVCSIEVPTVSFDCSTASSTVPPKTTTATTTSTTSTPPPVIETTETTSTTETAPSSQTSASTPSQDTTSGGIVSTSTTPAPGSSTAPGSSSTAPGSTTSETSSVKPVPSSSFIFPNSSTTAPGTTADSTPGTTPGSTPGTPSSTPGTIPGTSAGSTPGTTPGTTLETTSTTTYVTTFDTTSTLFTTLTSTITSCAPEVTECPNGGVKTTVVTIATSTTICPVTSTLTSVVTGPTSVQTPPVNPPVDGGDSTTQPAPGTTTTPGTGTVVEPPASVTSIAPIETLPCPSVVPSCLNTFLFSVGCSDNSDAACFCPDTLFIKNVFNCLYAHGESDDVISEAVIFIQGICAPYMGANPGIATDATVTTYITATATPTISVVTTVTLDVTTVVPCTDSLGSIIPSSSTTTTLSTTLTVPQLGFTTGTGGDVDVIPVTTALPIVTGPGGGDLVPTNGDGGFFTTPAPTGTGGLFPSSSAAFPPIVTAGAGRTGSGVGFAVAAAGLIAAIL
ncbi:hypothetical protein QBC37DRAFT_391817 [Rhypophila decipiens]|uniref:CFEM domain-containing protein n=1 Tax=Rhypophila decipiens TaxID=261697 RepID=A0AAN6XXE9_9PEZI|nr:hypothetical protein QBC37DRAFT_391817 [Rhypophila decipiens]